MRDPSANRNCAAARTRHTLDSVAFNLLIRPGPRRLFLQAEAYNVCKRPDSALRARASEYSISVDVQDYSSIKACSEAFDAKFLEIAGNILRQSYRAGGGKFSRNADITIISRTRSPCLARAETGLTE